MNINFDFNHRVVLEKGYQSNDACGEIIEKWEIIAEVWANIAPISAKQNFSRFKQDTEISHTITIRYRKDAKECKKIIFNDRSFEVLGVISPKENYNFLTFNVKELC